MIRYATYTDVGRREKGNQDSHCLLSATMDGVPVVLAAVCDGVGGLEGGERASSSAIRLLSQWFSGVLPRRAELLPQAVRDDGGKFVTSQLDGALQRLNAALWERGEERGATMGTTLTVLFLYGSVFQTVQVGDSRAYRYGNGAFVQLTEDQTLVNQEVKRGNLTPEQAKSHPKANVILQAVGAQQHLQPVYSSGTAPAGSLFLLCSDGFCHMIGAEELSAELEALEDASDAQIQATLERLVQMNLDRGERDNITVLCFGTGEGGGSDTVAAGTHTDTVVRRGA